ncbi:alkaline phosphatase family protein [Microlunatus sp. Y2014]|uniref:alkaline phosphatase family protein n=1 Tax=Microlunatus sp. Y2014 TaxID=3418488 RepID=UPI003DA78DD8
MTSSPLHRSTSRRAVMAGALAGTAALALAHRAEPARAVPGRPARADHVVLIGWDGFDPAYYGLAPTPNLDRLIALGSRSTTQGVMTSITNPSWSSVATGAWPERHLNTAYWYDPELGTGRGQMRDLTVPTIAHAVRDAGGTVASAQWFILQNYGTAYGDPEGLYMQNGGAERRFNDMIDVIEGRPVKSGSAMVTAPRIPDFMAVYCDNLDALGHGGGEHNPELPAALVMLDANLGRLIAALEKAGIFDRTAFVLQGDHGMTTFTRANGQQILDAIAATGHTGEFLGNGQVPSAGTDVVLVVGGAASVHLLTDSARADLRRIQRAIARVEGVAGVYDKGWQRANHMSSRHGELIIDPADDWSLGLNPPASPVGRHGSTADCEAFFMIGGCGIVPGRQTRNVRHVDVAPTMAALLGIPAPSGAQGRVLNEVIARP